MCMCALVKHYLNVIASNCHIIMERFAYCLKVLEVVRNNYDTLTLKLQDNLDHYEKYSERPKESTFFTQLVRAHGLV